MPRDDNVSHSLSRMHLCTADIQESYEREYFARIVTHFIHYDAQISQGEMPPELEIVSNISAKVFIEACLQRKDSRPSAAQLSTHEFLQANETDDFKLVRIKLRAETKIHLEGWEEHEGEEGDEEDVVVYHDGGVVTDGVRPIANNSEQQQDAVSPSGLAAKTVSGGGDKYLREKSGSFSPRANKHTNGEFSKGYQMRLLYLSTAVIYYHLPCHAPTVAVRKKPKI